MFGVAGSDQTSPKRMPSIEQNGEKQENYIEIKQLYFKKKDVRILRKYLLHNSPDEFVGFVESDEYKKKIERIQSSRRGAQ